MFMPLLGIGIVAVLAMFGSLTQILPGPLILVGGVLIWAFMVGGAAWAYFAGVAVIVIIASVLKYVLAGKYMSSRGVGTKTILLATILGIIGFFVIPIVGLPLGFVAGIYLIEAARDRGLAWERTKTALKGVGVSILVELSATALGTGLWILGYFMCR